jgi:hypothetical protein
LARYLTLPDDAEHCDVLFFGGSLRQALAQVLTQPARLRAACLVVPGGMGVPWEEAQQMKALLLQATGASGMVILEKPEAQRRDWLVALVEGLSHNLTLDVALARLESGAAHYLFASPRLLAQALLANVARTLSGRLADMPGSVNLDVAPVALQQLGQGTLKGVNMPGPTPAELAGLIASGLESYQYAGESHEATGISGVEQSVARAVQEGAMPAAERRYIQARVFETPLKAKEVRGGLHSDTDYLTDVRVGPQEAGWLAPPSKNIFPDWELPEYEQGHLLTVVFSEPQHAPQPQVQRIFLPRKGASTTCRFYFHTLARESSFDARIMLLYENRVLQTARLRAGVQPGTDGSRTGKRLRMEIEAALRPGLAGLEDRRHFDLALLVNESNDGQHRLTEVSGEQARLVTLDGLKEAIDELREMLKSIPDNPDDFKPGPPQAATEDLLRDMALRGNDLYRALVLDQVGSRDLAASRRLQLISATEEAFLPLEFVYDKPAPALDATLCLEALKDEVKGECSDCPANGAGLDDEKYPNGYPKICPLGFWGLSRVIERQAIVPGKKDGPGAFEFDLLSEPFEGRTSLALLSKAVFAASSRVDKDKKGLIQSVLQALQNVTGDHAIQVETWADWRSQVQAESPSLLVLLPHSLKVKNKYNALEISSSQDLVENYLTDAYVHPNQAGQRPLVLLLGCETLNPDIPFQGFMARFRQQGAAIVLGTATAVLGRHAAPVAVMVADILGELAAKGPYTFGEALQLLRRRALGRNLPMVMALVAYGDADWRIG